MITEARDASRSFEEWLKLDKTALVLKCNSYNINATGKKAVLIDRLMRHFDRDEINMDVDDNNSDDDDDYNGCDYDVL